jgi:hypothetical protein
MRRERNKEVVSRRSLYPLGPWFLVFRASNILLKGLMAKKGGEGNEGRVEK